MINQHLLANEGRIASEHNTFFAEDVLLLLLRNYFYFLQSFQSESLLSVF